MLFLTHLLYGTVLLYVSKYNLTCLFLNVLLLFHAKKGLKGLSPLVPPTSMISSKLPILDLNDQTYSIIFILFSVFFRFERFTARICRMTCFFSNRAVIKFRSKLCIIVFCVVIHIYFDFFCPTNISFCMENTI